MIDLIPKEEKKKNNRNFYFKIVILVFTLMGVLFLIATIAVLPSYFLSSVKSNIINAKIAMQSAEPVPTPDQQTVATIKDVNNKLKIVEGEENKNFTVSGNVINEIISKKMSGIKITEISYDNDTGTGPSKPGKISIRGTAPSREILLMFRNAIEGDPMFKQVDLPVSNFVKGSNIQFYLSLTSA